MWSFLILQTLKSWLTFRKFICYHNSITLITMMQWFQLDVSLCDFVEFWHGRDNDPFKDIANNLWWHWLSSFHISMLQDCNETYSALGLFQWTFENWMGHSPHRAIHPALAASWLLRCSFIAFSQWHEWKNVQYAKIKRCSELPCCILLFQGTYYPCSVFF